MSLNGEVIASPFFGESTTVAVPFVNVTVHRPVVASSDAVIGGICTFLTSITTGALFGSSIFVLHPGSAARTTRATANTKRYFPSMGASVTRS